MKQYLDLVKKVLKNGISGPDRTGTGTKSIFGEQMRINLKNGFPLLTTKKINFRNVAGELIWILRGSTNNDELREITYGKDSNKKTIWEPWTHPETGELGAVYGEQLRRWNRHAGNDVVAVDQLRDLLYNLEHHPYSRRHVVCLWNASDLPIEKESHVWNIENGFSVLPPCHVITQFKVQEINDVKHLSCILFQRSCDTFIGVPYNIASYALLTHIIAHRLDMVPHEFIHMFGDLHIYSNHYEQVNEQLNRIPGKLPRLIIRERRDNIWDYEVDDFELIGYNPQKFIKAPVSV